MISAGGLNAGLMNINRSDAGVFTRNNTPFKETLPLAADHFKKPRLSSNTVTDFERAAHALADIALDRSRKERIYGGADESWRDIGAAHGFKRYTKVEGQSQNYRVHGVIRAPMTNVMGLLYVERNAEVVERRNTFYGNAMDAQTLYVLRERSPADMHQHMSLRWEAFNVATTTENYKFDATVLEYTGIALDADRQPVGFKITHSVDLPHGKPLLKTHGLHRVDMTETMVLRPTSNNTNTEFTLEGSFVVDERLPSSALSSYLTQIAQHLGRIPMEIQTRRLTAMKIIHKDMWVPANERKNCSVCLSRFGVLGKKHHCRSCGEVICKSCVVSRPNREELKFCKKCVVVACAEDELVIPDRQPVQTPSSSSTSSTQTRDSYASSHNRLSEERLSASVFNPQVYNPHQQPIKPAPRQQQQQPQHQHHYQQPQHNHQHHHDYRYADDLKHHAREDNHSLNSNSMTASETSFSSSTFSSSGYIESSTPEFNDYDRPEGSMIYLDTRQMMRGTPSSLSNDDGMSNYGSGRGQVCTPASMHDVESSLAQQRHILQEMMYQANLNYRPNAPVKVKY